MLAALQVLIERVAQLERQMASTPKGLGDESVELTALREKLAAVKL